MLIWHSRWIRLMLGALLTVTIGVSVARSETRERTLFVATNGNDSWSGRLPQPNAMRSDGPFASIEQARDALRKERLADQVSGPVTVLIRDGVYPLKKSLVFTPEDSGTPESSITYAAYPGERPVFSGGRVIRGFKRVEGGLWQTCIPDIRDGKWRFEQLYINGRRAIRARTPNTSYFYTEGSVSGVTDPKTGKRGTISDRVFLAQPVDIAHLLAVPPDQLRHVVVVAYHSWDVSRHNVSAIETSRSLVYLAGSYPPKFGHHVTQERYYLENFRKALDSPGEWFLDPDGTLTYKPHANEDLDTAEVVAPMTEVLLQLAGKSVGQPVAYITFQGLAFRYAGYLMPRDMQWSAQAACEIGAVIQADYAERIAFRSCEVEHTGTYGMWFRDGCRNSSIEHCFFGDLGAGGVRLGQTSRLPAAHEVTSYIRLDNNIIRGGGRLWPDAVGILIGHSGNNQVTHNDISLLAYTGISVGWRWGYGEVPSKRNVISYNNIHHLGGDILADMGGIYTLGEARGTVLANNVIHDIDGDGASGMHGIYNDNSTSAVVVENNLIYNVRDGGYHIGSGKGNILRNNIFVADPRNHSKHGQLTFSMYKAKENHVAATFERNIFYGSGGKLFSMPEFGSRLEFRNNVYWEPSGMPLDFAGKTFDEWRKHGRDQGSVVADPKFKNPVKRDFGLKQDSPALKLGFVPFDPKQAGVYGSPAWVLVPEETLHCHPGNSSQKKQ